MHYHTSNKLLNQYFINYVLLLNFCYFWSKTYLHVILIMFISRYLFGNLFALICKSFCPASVMTSQMDCADGEDEACFLYCVAHV